MQVQVSGTATAEYTGVLQALRRVAAKEGLAGLYRGFSITAVLGAPAAMLYFTSYEVARDALKSSLPAMSRVEAVPHLLAGLVAEAFSCVLWVPVDVVKERMQVQRAAGSGAAASATYYTSTPHALRSIMAGEGLAGLYRGYWATLLSFGPFSALYFLLYEEGKAAARRAWHTHPDAALPPYMYAAIGAGAGAGAAWLTTPLDLAKLRLQVQRAAGGVGPMAYGYRGVWHALTSVAADEGPLALFRGAGARMAFSAPMTAISFALFESCKAAFQAHLD